MKGKQLNYALYYQVKSISIVCTVISLKSLLFFPGISSWIDLASLLGPSFTEVSSELVTPSGVLLGLVSFSFPPFFLGLEMKAAVYLPYTFHILKLSQG